LIFTFNRRAHGRLRCLIDFVNACDAPAGRRAAMSMAV